MEGSKNGSGLFKAAVPGWKPLAEGEPIHNDLIRGSAWSRDCLLVEAHESLGEKDPKIFALHFSLSSSGGFVPFVEDRLDALMLLFPESARESMRLVAESVGMSHGPVVIRESTGFIGSNILHHWTVRFSLEACTCLRLGGSLNLNKEVVVRTLQDIEEVKAGLAKALSDAEQKRA